MKVINSSIVKRRILITLYLSEGNRNKLVFRFIFGDNYPKNSAPDIQVSDYGSWLKKGDHLITSLKLQLKTLWNENKGEPT
eukprot:UN07712